MKKTMKKAGSGRRWGAAARMAGGLAAGLLAVQAPAAQKVWTGGGADDYLSTPANWEDGTAPASGDVLVFQGNVRTAPVNDYDPETTSFETLVFANTGQSTALSAPFTLSGNKIVLTGGSTFADSGGRRHYAVYTANAKGSVTDVLDLEVALPNNAAGTSKLGGFQQGGHHLLFKRTVTSGNGGHLRSSDQMLGNLTFEGPVVGFSGVTRVNGRNGQIWLRSAANAFTEAEPACQLQEGTLKVDSVAAAGGAGIRLTLGQASYDTPGKFVVNAAENTLFTGDVTVRGPSNTSKAGQLVNDVAGTTATFTGDFTFTKGYGPGTGLLVGGAGDGVLAGDILTAFAWLYKEGAGTWTLAGDSCATGAVTVSAGTLVVDGDHGAARRSQVKAGATLGGSGRLGDVAFASGARFAAASLAGGAPLHVEALELAGEVTLVREGEAKLEPGTYTLITYGARTGDGYFASGMGLPGVSAVTLGETNATLTVSAHVLDWSGTASGTWDFTTENWTEAGVAFADGDAVAFDETAARTDVEVAGTVRPGGVLVSGAKDYAFTGAGLAGDGGLEKTGSGALTLANTNAYTGATFVNGGALVLAGTLAGTTVRVGAAGAWTNLPTGRLTGPGAMWINGRAWLDGTNDFTGGLHVGGAVTVRNPRALGDGDVFVGNTSAAFAFSGRGGEAGRGHTLDIDKTGGDSENNSIEASGSGVTVRWLGDVVIRGSRLLLRSKPGSRLVFGEPGCTTTVRGSGIYMRESGAVDWYSRFDMSEGWYEQTDYNTTCFYAPGNRWGGLKICANVVRCCAAGTLAPAPVRMGQKYGTHTFHPVLDLNGFDQTITELLLSEESIEGSSQTVQSAAPATLTVSNDVDTATVRMQGRITGAVTLRKDGAGTWSFGAQNLTTGNVAVVAGTLALTASDALPVGALSTLEIASGAKVVLADGVSASIPYLTCGGIPFAPGVYCGEGGASGRRLDRFFGPGGGTLTVTRGVTGLAIIFR